MISETLYRVGLIVAITLVNVMIAFTCGAAAMFYCINTGWSKTPTLMITIAVAVLVTGYIRFNHLIIQRIQMEKKQ